MSNSPFDREPLQPPRGRTEQEVLQQLRKELKRGVNILTGGVHLADVMRLRLSDEMEIRRQVELLVQRAEKKFGHGHEASQRHLPSDLDAAVNQHLGLNQ